MMTPELIVRLAASMDQEARANLKNEIEMRNPTPFQESEGYGRADKVYARRQVDRSQYQLAKLATEFLRMHKK